MDYMKTKLSLKGPVFSLDVECVAVGKTHQIEDRYPAKFALVDEAGRSICTCLIKPDKPIVSYLTPLTGLRQSNFSGSDPDLRSAIGLLKRHLPKEAILVGQNIDHDIEWMQLTKGTDFQESIDLAEIFKGWNSKYNTYTVKTKVCISYQNGVISRLTPSIPILGIQCTPFHEWYELHTRLRYVLHTQ